MVLCKVTQKENYDLLKGTYFVFFEYLGRIKKALITTKVLEYNKVDSVDIGDEVFVVKTFNPQSLEVYLVKNVKKRE